MTSKIIEQHIKFLKEEVFFVNTKWPHFNLLFDDIEKLSKEKKYGNVISLERASLYGDISLFGPYFHKKKFTAIDCSTKKLDQEDHITKNMFKITKLSKYQ